METDKLEYLESEVKRLQDWVNDLQSGMYINCVYCGHQYGPNSDVPATMADVLKEHIEQCPKHPMSKLKAQAKSLCAKVDEVINCAEDDVFEFGSILSNSLFDENKKLKKMV